MFRGSESLSGWAIQEDFKTKTMPTGLLDKTRWKQGGMEEKAQHGRTRISHRKRWWESQSKDKLSLAVEVGAGEEADKSGELGGQKAAEGKGGVARKEGQEHGGGRVKGLLFLFTASSPFLRLSDDGKVGGC